MGSGLIFRISFEIHFSEFYKSVQGCTVHGKPASYNHVFIIVCLRTDTFVTMYLNLCFITIFLNHVIKSFFIMWWNHVFEISFHNHFLNHVFYIHVLIKLTCKCAQLYDVVFRAYPFLYSLPKLWYFSVMQTQETSRVRKLFLFNFFVHQKRSKSAIKVRQSKIYLYNIIDDTS